MLTRGRIKIKKDKIRRETASFLSCLDHFKSI